MYSIRMAGIFMLVLGNIWVCTEVMPRWLVGVSKHLGLGVEHYSVGCSNGGG